MFRRQKNQSANIKPMSATAPPTDPPTIGPRLGAEVAVGDGVAELVLEGVGVLDEVGVGEGVVVSPAIVVGAVEANAPIPVSIGVAAI